MPNINNLEAIQSNDDNNKTNSTSVAVIANTIEIKELKNITVKDEQTNLVSSIVSICLIMVCYSIIYLYIYKFYILI